MCNQNIWGQKAHFSKEVPCGQGAPGPQGPPCPLSETARICQQAGPGCHTWAGDRKTPTSLPIPDLGNWICRVGQGKPRPTESSSTLDFREQPSLHPVLRPPPRKSVAFSFHRLPPHGPLTFMEVFISLMCKSHLSSCPLGLSS